MSDVFDQALEDIFNSDAADAAMYQPCEGDAVPCQVSVEKETDMQPGGFDATAWATGTTLEVRLAEIGKEPDRGETFTMTVAGTVYTVKKVIENDGRIVKVAVK